MAHKVSSFEFNSDHFFGFEELTFLIIPCTVYGFDIPGQPLESPTFTGVESSDQYTLAIRMIKGIVGNRVDLDAELLPGGTAGGT